MVARGNTEGSIAEWVVVIDEVIDPTGESSDRRELVINTRLTERRAEGALS